MGRTVTAKQHALATARARRVAMDAERDVRDRRVEDATATALVSLAERAKVAQDLARLNLVIGNALRRVLDEGVSVDGAAHLLELDVAEVKRLARDAQSADGGDTSARTVADEPRLKGVANIPEVRTAAGTSG